MTTNIKTLFILLNVMENSVSGAGPVYLLRYKGGHDSLGRYKELISYIPICSTTKRIFLGWVKEVRTTKP
jgi:hypothetical protein